TLLSACRILSAGAIGLGLASDETGPADTALTISHEANARSAACGSRTNSRFMRATPARDGTFAASLTGVDRAAFVGWPAFWAPSPYVFSAPVAMLWRCPSW